MANEKRVPDSGDPLATERENYVSHRISVYREMGFSQPAATLMAQTQHDPEKIASWIRAGCTIELAMRIAL